MVVVFLKCTYNNLFKLMEFKFMFKDYIIFFSFSDNEFFYFFETKSYYIFLNLPEAGGPPAWAS